MSGMLTGTFFSRNRIDLVLLKEIEESIDAMLKPNPALIDRQKTFRALPYMTNFEIENNLERIGNFRMPNIPVINVVGAMTSDYISKKGSPLKMFLTYNQRAHLTKYASDGFIELSKTMLPKEVFPNEKVLVLESTHLLADGNFDQYDLTNKETRVSFYQALFQALIH